MKTTTAVLCMILAVPTLVLAQAPATRPGPEAYRGRRFRMDPAATRPANQQEWDDAVAFIKQHAPHLGRALDFAGVSENSRLRDQVLKKWRNYKLLSDKFPEMAVLAVKRIEIEDEIFALGGKLRDGSTSQSEAADEAHDLAAKLVDLSVQERETRIKRLTKLLQDEQSALAIEQSHLNELIDKRANLIKNRLPTTNPSRSETAPSPDDVSIPLGAVVAPEVLPDP